MQNGDKVRLLGINTPEKGQPYYEEATNRLKELIEGKTVTLEKDIEDKDQYERLLRYIYIDDTFVNLEMVREGYANVTLSLQTRNIQTNLKKPKKKLKMLEEGYGNSQKICLNASAFSIFIGMQKAMIVIISTMSMLPLKILALSLLI
ncbi:MAG: thermonuclease family protein [archaeon]|nr:thermonuclease family protein [archaeon]